MISDLDECKAYIDNAIIYSEVWDQHLQTIRTFFDRLSHAKLTVNLAKSEFCHANLMFLGHIVGQGQVKPVEAKVEAISDFPVPTGKRQLMHFLGAGSVLLQEDDNGVDHPVCYFSKKFNKHQRNYSTIEKECLSLILALQHFEVYLASSHAPIVVFSDHNPLTFIHKMKNKNQRLLRWSLMLQEHNLDIRHIKGRDNIIPDALSRA